MRRGLRTAVNGLLIGSLAVSCSPAAPPQADVERVVMITIDTLRADHVGAYGASQAGTSVLDGLSQAGVRFDVATSPAPVTLPAHTSLFSARDPAEHGVRHNGLFQVDEGLPLLTESLSEAGFATAAFVGAFVLDRRFGLSRGFDTYDDEMSIDRGTAGTFGFAERTADQVVDRALSWLDEAPSRFFLWAHFYDPHADYRPPPGFALAFPGRPYAGEIAFTDFHLGRLLTAIDERWPDGKTLIVVTSDHGESLGEHGESTHSYLIYEPTQRIPLIMKGPGIPPGTVVTAPVRLIDVAPTVLALTGLPPLEGASGIDLRDRIAGKEGPPLVTYMETLAPHFDFGWASLVGVREGDLKLIEGTRTELYDLAADPGETRNLAEERPEDVARLRVEIDTRIEEGGDPTPTRQIEEEERQRLVALGYLLPEEGSAPAGSWLEGPDPNENVAAIHRVTEAGILLEQGRWNDALALLEGLEAGSLPEWARAAALFGLGRLDEAERHARAAVVPGTPSPGPRVMLGRVLAAQGRTDDALAEFSEAEALSPGDPGPPLGAGRALLDLGRRAEAAEAFERAAQSRGTKAQVARLERAALALEDGDCDEAERWIEGRPEDPVAGWRAELRLALAEQRAGRLEAARSRVESAIEEDGDQPVLWATLASLEREAGDLDASIEARAKTLSLAPSESWAKNDLAYVLGEAGRDLDRALELAREASASGDPNFLDTLASVLLARGDAEGALETVERALAAPEVGAARRHLELLKAEALAGLGRRGDAREFLRSSTEGLAERPYWAPQATALAGSLGSEVSLPAASPPTCP